jgi:squalene-hopene/tetraprenyl-beta-curcumene cyclase
MRTISCVLLGGVLLMGCGEKPGKTPVVEPGDAGAPAKDAATKDAGTKAPDGKARPAAADKAVKFLLSSQNEDGGFGSFKGEPMSSVGVTALVCISLMESPAALKESSNAVLAKAIQYIVENQQPTGALTVAGQGLENYHTSSAVMALKRTGNPAYKDALDKAEEFLRGIQLGEENGFDKDNPFFGGAGYSPGAKYSDLSNTSFWIDAMKELGVENDDPAMQNALVFVRRVTNNAEVNDLAWAKDVAPEDYGSAVYRPAEAPGREGEVDVSKAGRGSRQGWRGYGSMTYAMFKSYIYAGVKADDVAVKGALQWIEKNYTVDENPGIGGDGQYYYYRLMAKALAAYGQKDIGGHAWAVDLADKLVSLQNEDGSWVNAKDRWHEGDPALVTAYALEALRTAMGEIE